MGVAQNETDPDAPERITAAMPQPAKTDDPAPLDNDAAAQPRPGPQSPAVPMPAALPPNSLTLSVFHELLLALAHGHSQEQVLHLLADKARMLTGCASAAVALLDDDREYVSFAAASGENADEIAGTRVHVSDSVLGNTARTGEPYLAFSPSARNRKDEKMPPVESAAVVPLFADGQPIGALAGLNKSDNQPFSGDDLLCLSTLAAGASVVIGNSRLRGEAQRQGRELSILYEAVRNVSGQLSAQEVLEAVVEQTSAHMDSSAVAVFLTNDERTHLYIAGDRGLTTDQREVTLPTDSGLGAAVLSAARPLFLSFTGEDEEDYLITPVSLPGEQTQQQRGSSSLTATLEAPFPGLGARSGLAAPIRAGDAAQGLVLVVSGQTQGVYTLADANLLSALASQAAVAMENAWLFEDTTRRAEEAAALYELSQTVTSTLRLEVVLERVADSVLSLLSVDQFALFLYDRRSERLQMVVERGLPEGASERIRPAVGQGIPGWVMEFETPTAVQHVAADHRNASSPLHPEGVVSMTCMPLQIGAGTIGVLSAMSTRRRLFTVAEMELLYTIANQAAIAIENARVYADVRQKSRELRKYFHRVARALGSSQSPRAVPQLIASLTLEVMGADRCVLYAVREKAGESGGQYLEMAARAGYRAAGESEAGNDSAAAAARIGEDTPAGWVARRARPLTIEDLADDARFTEGLTRPLRGRAASYLGVPLRSGQEVVGVLEIYTRARRQWRGDEVRLLLTFASQAVVAFQNARLAEESGQAARTTQVLQRLLEMFTEDGPPPLADTVLTTLAEGLDAGIALLRRGGEETSDDGKSVWRWEGGSGLSREKAETLARDGSEHGSRVPAGVIFVTGPGEDRALMATMTVENREPSSEIVVLLKAGIRLLERER